MTHFKARNLTALLLVLILLVRQLDRLLLHAAPAYQTLHKLLIQRL